MAHQSLIAFRYRLHEELGSGGMGAVYRVYDQLNATYVALKRVNIPTELLDFMSLGSIGSSSGLWVALAEEFKILASLRHPNIISVLDYGFDSTRQPYYTMELLSTPQNLLDYGRDKPLVEKINLLVKVLEALSYLHRRGIIHRDLKPDNALVVNGQVKVLDFGLAVARNKLGDNTPVGTLHYISPEVLNGKPISQSADLYAVGVMAYQLLTGLYPFNLNQSLTELALTIIEQPVNFDDLDLNPALKVVLSKLLAKTPNERYASATEAIEAFYYAIGQEPPVETTTSRDSFIQAAEFVGRQEELKTLINALDNAINRQGSAWLVGGESGVGKSRLLDELRTQALVEGVLVLRGQAVEGGGLPYQVWREPLRRLVLSVDLTNLEAGILKPIVPDISTLLGRDIADVPELPGDAGTARLAGVILSLFERQTETVVLLLEDLQWAQSSLFVLRHLLTHIAQLPLLVIGNYRNDEAPYLPSQLIGMQSIILPRLSTEEIIQLSVEMLGEGGKDPVIVERLSKETEGNTFFMVEIVRALAEVAGRLDKVGSMTLPHSIMAGSIHRILQRRIERVAAWGQPLLTLAAVIGRQIKRPLLETLLASDATLLETHDLDTWLNICIEASVFDIQDENWRFAHDKLREFLLNKLDGIERALMNGMVAKAIETTYPNDSAYHELLYNHWREAGNVEREIHYMLLVVKQMVQIRATHTEAEQLIQRGLTLLNENDVQYITLLNWRAESHRLRSLHEPAKEYAQAALALAEQLGVKGEMATSLNSLGMIDWIQGKYATATDYFQRSLELYHKINDKAGIAKNLNSLGIIASSRGDYASSEDYFQQSLAHYREIDDKVGIGMSLNGLGVVAKNRGDYTVAENYLQENR
ncbi:MAG: tetratricopeptide repeat protein [Anaerolineae bacterium]|nr:tetratricopeptide repeat protein [Anaerolineae bacterium]